MRIRLYFGPLAAIVLCIGVVGLPVMVPGFNSVHQTVSEIGEMDSPARLPFAVMLCLVGLCLLVFASAIRRLSLDLDRGPAAAYFIGAMAVSAFGVGVFAYPHPLHNVFGTSELIGYQAPLLLALTWRGERRVKMAIAFSAIMAVLVWLAIAANLAIFDRHGIVWQIEKPFYGLIQRALFATWFVWCAGTGLLLARASRVPG